MTTTFVAKCLTMFKSQIPLQTPLAIKVVLSTIILTFFAGWSLSGDASGEELNWRRQIVASNKQDSELDSLVQKVHAAVNEYRASQNLPPLKLNAQISKQAQIHSQNMAQEEVKFSHVGFDDRVDTLGKSIAYTSAAENVAYNQGYQDPASKAVAGWIKSPGHKKNMVGNYNLTGIGVAKNKQGEYYFTQIFILGK